MIPLFMKNQDVEEICVNDGECVISIIRDEEGYRVDVFGRDYLSDKAQKVNYYGEPLVEPVGEVYASFEELEGDENNDD